MTPILNLVNLSKIKIKQIKQMIKMKKKGVDNIQINSKYIIVISDKLIKKQSKEYTIL